MERKALSFLLMCVVIGMSVGQSNAFWHGFKDCMKNCLIQCAIPPWTPSCPAMCMGKCIIHPFAKGTESSHQFCTSGCATSKCYKLISKENDRLDEVESCVNGCSQTCVINYRPAN
ncbi:thionin-like protein 2 [Ricinus communis]|uniref:thionin-like protein 2 n=1 Tax=Ricinus communis TaxID=3988 RepID=UPI00201A595E|nr:thionin-like protein 2 [Ricinus communis]